MHQALHLRLVQFHEQAEAGHAADHAVELPADVLFHPRRAVTLVDLALGLIGATLTLGTLQRQRGHFARVVGELVQRLAGQRGLDRAMHQQIGVAADRRSEVRVRLQRQAEVAVVVRAVDRQALAAQQHRFQQRGIGAVADLLQQLGVVAGAHLRPRRQAQLELLEEFQQVGVLGFRWLLVDAVRGRHVARQQVLGRLDVGRDHAFLDQLVRVVAHQHAGLGHFAAVVQHETHFAAFELDGTALGARLRQHLVQLVQALHLRQQIAHPGLGARASSSPLRRSANE
ncbi:hypothetical protein G6F32_013749 [Rhizopus arrhizus]|nr:hypothetical protein G6F32_013749 [Rhizopus arrhizus]